MLEDLYRIKNVLTHTLSEDVSTRNYHQYTRLLSLYATTYGNIPKGSLIKPKEIKRLTKLGMSQSEKVEKYASFVETNKEYLKKLSLSNIDMFNNMDFYYVYAPDKYKVFKSEYFTDIIYDFFEDLGYEDIIFKYLKDDRIKFLLNGKHHCGEYVYLPYIQSGFIKALGPRMDSGSANVIAHEVGHAIDGETHLFAQQKKCSNFYDTLIEVPSTCMELLFDDYLIDKHIDEVGGLLLKNQKAELLNHYTSQLVLSLNYDYYYYNNDGDIIDFDTMRGFANLRDSILYGLGYEFAYHFSILLKNDKKEFKKLFNNLITSRFETKSLEENIEIMNFNSDDFLTSKMIEPIIKEDFIKLKKNI